MDGLETAHLTQSWLAKLNTFQLRGFRQILKMNTTFVQRENTNREVIRRATQASKSNASLPLASEVHEQRRVKWAAKVALLPNAAPVRRATFHPNSVDPVEPDDRRVGRPRISWAEGTHSCAWLRVRHGTDQQDEPPNPRCGSQRDWVHLSMLLEEL